MLLRSCRWAGGVAGAIALALASPASATDHSGSCSGTFTAAGNPHVLTGTCTVPASGSLTLEPGVVLQATGSGPQTLLVGAGATLTANQATLTRVVLSFSSGSSGSIQDSTLSAANSFLILASSADVDVQDCAIDVPGSASSTGLVQYSGTATGTVSGNTFTLTGTSAAIVIAVSGSASPAISGNDFVDNAARTQTYVDVRVAATSTLAITGNTFRASGSDLPLVLDGNAIAAPLAISGNTFPTGTGAGARITGTLTTSATLFLPAGLPTVLSQTVSGSAQLTVTASAPATVETLHVNAGATLVLQPGAQLTGAAAGNGSIQVSGTLQATSATVQALALSFASGSNGSIQTSTLTPPNGATALRASGTAHVDLLDSNVDGPVTVSSAGLVVYEGSATGTIDGNTLALSGSQGPLVLAVAGTASPAITGNEFLDNATRGQTYVELSVSAPSSASVTGNVFRASPDDVPIRLVGNALAASLTISGNSYPTGVGSGARLTGNLSANATVAAPDGLPVTVVSLTVQTGATLTLPAGVPTAVEVQIAVQSGASLALSPGAELRAASGLNFATLNLAGDLQASGASFQRIVLNFTAGGTGTVEDSSFANAAGFYTVSVASADVDLLDNDFVIDALAPGSGVILYSGTATGSISGNSFTSLASAPLLISVGGTASPVIANNDFVDALALTQTYVQLSVSAASSASVTGNVFRASTSDVPIALVGDALAAPLTISGNSFPTGNGAGASVSGSLTTSAALYLPNGLPVTLGAVTVQTGATLTIPNLAVVLDSSITVQTGAALVVSPGAQLSTAGTQLASVNVNGSLVATGASFTRVGPTFNSGGSGAIQSSTFVNASGSSVVTVNGADVDLVGNQFALSSSASSTGVVVYSGTATGEVSGNTFTTQNVSVPVLIAVSGTASPAISGNDFLDQPAQAQTCVSLSVGVASTASITGNTFRVSGSDLPIALAGNSAAAALTISGNFYPTGTALGAQLSGTLAASWTAAPPDGLPLRTSSLVIASGATLTLPASAPLTLSSTTTVQPGGALVLQTGAALAPVSGSVQLTVNGSLQATNASFDRIRVNVNAGASGSIQGSAIATPASDTTFAVSGALDLLNNTFVASSGQLSSGSIVYSGTATGTISGNTFTTTAANVPILISLTGSASPDITGNDFVDSAANAQTYVDLSVDATSTAAVTGNVFRASGNDVPLTRNGNALAAALNVSGNTYPTGVGAGNRIGGTLTTTALARRIDGQPTFLASGFTVGNPGVLTIDAQSGLSLAALTVASGGALVVTSGASLGGSVAGATITVSSGGSATFERVALSALRIIVNGDVSISDSTLEGLTDAITVSATGRITLLRSTASRANGSLILDFGALGSVGTIRRNTFERTSASSGVRFSAGGAQVVLDENEFRVSGARWFAQRAARYQAVAAGSANVCGVLASGELRCAGPNGAGQASPPPVVGTDVAVGVTHGCTLRADHTAACWGSAGPHTSLPLTPYRRIAAGNGFTCAIRQSDRGLECYGGIAAPPPGTFLELSAGREAGQEYACALGTDARVQCWGSSSFGATAAPSLAFAEVSAGDRHACARLFDGTLSCWGDNASGQTSAPSGAFVELASGSLHSCARRFDGTVACWGSNASAQTAAPNALFLELAAGGAQSCGRRADDTLACWGGAAALATALSSIGEVAVALGADHACATTAAFGLGCWGQNGSGQATPPTPPAFVEIGSGGQFGCAATGSNLFTTSESFGFDCWGANGSGQSTENANARLSPAAGLNHACALTVAGAAVCWGDNSFGQSTVPPATFVALSAGSRHTCGISNAGTLACWGAPDNGRTTPPPGTFTKLAAGADHSCALRDDGTVLCWGLNDFGQSTAIPGVYTDVAAGDVFSCGLRGDGNAVCWGSSANGRTNPAPGPFARLDAGAGRACGVRTNGALGCWGASLGGSPAPNDLDVDGITDGGDNCPVNANFAQADLEGDVHGDLCDNCPSTYARDQDDRDGDGVGDACDNCVSIVNPGQEDADLNGFGDACEDATVILRYVAPPPPPPGPPGFGPLPPPAPGDQEYDIYVSCGTLPIRRVELGVILPQGTLPANVSFGPGCTPTTCVAATGLGSTVNAALSRASGPGLATPGTRPDTVYFSLAGSGPPDNRLCSPFEENRAGRFVLANSPIAPPVPNLTTEGLAPLGLVPLTDAFNRVMLPEEYGFVAQDATPVLGLTLQPALHDTTGRRWQVELDANLAMNKVTFGLVAPAGTTTAQMRFTGCTTLSGSPATRRICAANSALGAYVAPAGTFTVGPGASASGLRPDTLYVSVTGALPSASVLPALNAAQQPTLLGVVELDSTTIQPALTADGVGTASVFATPFVNAAGQTVPTQAVQIAGGYNAPSDYDADARSDDLDNCPFQANYDQVDRGGLSTLVPNGRGDRCECGEATDDGAIFAADSNVIRQLLAGLPVSSPLIAQQRCSVAATPGCDVADVAVLRRALAGLGPFPVAACTSAVR